MVTNGKSFMFSARLPADLVERVDFVARNSEDPNMVTRSAAVHDALNKWLPEQERRLTALGLTPPKKAR